MSRIGVVDIGQGNIESICNIVFECGYEVERLQKPPQDKILDWLILPGVGNFGSYASLLKETKWHNFLKSEKNTKILAICVGFQYLANSSDEYIGENGLGIVDSTVHHLGDFSNNEKVPHVGWKEIPELEGRFYFTHSYYMPASCKVDRSILLGFGQNKIAVFLQKDNFFGVQFHPEKSGKNGINFFSKLFRD